jgi:hypothetical protein
MISVRKYLIGQTGLTICSLLFMISVTGKHLQYAVFFFPISAILFILVTYPEIYALSRYIKDRYPMLYRKRSSYRKFYFKDLLAVNFWSLTKSELIQINDQQIVTRIKKLKFIHNAFLANIIIMFLVVVAKSYS